MKYITIIGSRPGSKRRPDQAGSWPDQMIRAGECKGSDLCFQFAIVYTVQHFTEISPTSWPSREQYPVTHEVLLRADTPARAAMRVAALRITQRFCRGSSDRLSSATPLLRDIRTHWDCTTSMHKTAGPANGIHVAPAQVRLECIVSMTAQPARCVAVSDGATVVVVDPSCADPDLTRLFSSQATERPWKCLAGGNEQIVDIYIH